MFIWRCVHDSIGVKGCLVRRGVGTDDLCPICREEKETVLHALRDCPRARALWLQLGVRNMNQDFWRSEPQDWFASNGSLGSRTMHGKSQWSMLFSFAIWMLWKSRNQVVFTGKAQNPNLLTEIENHVTEFMYCVSSPRCSVPRELLCVVGRSLQRAG